MQGRSPEGAALFCSDDRPCVAAGPLHSGLTWRAGTLISAANAEGGAEVEPVGPEPHARGGFLAREVQGAPPGLSDGRGELQQGICDRDHRPRCREGTPAAIPTLPASYAAAPDCSPVLDFITSIRASAAA